MTVIKKYGYRLPEPSRREDEVNSMVSIDISRLNREAARRGENLNCVPPRCRQLELDQIIGRGRPDLAAIYSGEVRSPVAVEIGNRNGRPRSCRRNRLSLNIGSACCSNARGREAK
jgi:hypothetical protein